jgi:hypothetical protein
LTKKKTPAEIDTRKAKQEQRQEGNKESCHQRQHTQTKTAQGKNSKYSQCALEIESSFTVPSKKDDKQEEKPREDAF